MIYKEIICDYVDYESTKSEYSKGAFKFVANLFEIYVLDGEEHRIDGPSFISKYHSGKVKYEEYRLNGIRHRDNGPAFIDYYADGKVRVKRYYKNHSIHNINGPAMIEYDEHGNITDEHYYLNNIPIPKFIFEIETSEDLRSVYLDRIMEQYKLNLDNVPKDEAYQLLKRILYFENETLKKYQHPL